MKSAKKHIVINTQVSDLQKVVFSIVLRGSEDHALPGLRHHTRENLLYVS